MNRKTNSALAMAVAAVTGLGLTAYTVTAQNQSDPVGERQDRTQQQGARQDQKQDHKSQQASAPKLPQGVEQQGEADVSDVREVFGEVANAATIEGGFNDIVERFVDEDRNRFGEWFEEAGEEFTELNTAAEQLKRAFEEKFPEEELDIEGETAFAAIDVVQGEVQDPRQLAMNWPVKPTGEAAQAGAQAGEARLAGDEQTGEPGDQSNIEEGRTVAVAAVSGMKDKPALHVSLINEFPSAWKIDVPGDRMPQQVYQDLTQRIEMLATSTDQWPQDAEKVQQMIGYQVLSAIYGVKTDQQHMDGMEREGEMNRPDGAYRGQDDGTGAYSGFPS